MLTDAEAEKQRDELGLLGPSPVGLDGASERSDRPGTATSTEPENDKAPSEKSISMAGSPDSKRHIRRSLQRTLRDPTRRGSSKDMHPHHSSKKSGKNDSVSSSTLPEGAVVDSDDPNASSEGLKRHDGSFTVHGKKASVITFGGDWASMDAGERLKTLARNESQKDAHDRHSHASPPHGTIMSITEGKRASESGFMLAPRRSSISLKERRAISQNMASSGEELGTARGLRKFSSSSGPPNFGEDLQEVREEAARRNGSVAETSDGAEEEEGDDSSDEAEGADDITPRPNKQKPLDAAPIPGPSGLKA